MNDTDNFDAPRWVSRRAKKTQKSSRIIETVNTTSDGPLMKHAMNSKAELMMAQEHHLAADKLKSFTHKLRKQGYKARATAAVPSGKSTHGTSGGTMVLVSDAYTISMIDGVKDKADPWTLFPGRAAGVKIHGFVKGGILAISVYLVAGEPPDSASNWQILTRVAEVIIATGTPFILGGDFQCSPGALIATGWTESIRGEVACTGITTCITAASASEIDYFIMSPALRAVCSKPSLFLDSRIATHTPVRTWLTGNARAGTIRTIQTPKEFPRHQVYGPERKQIPWDPFCNSASGSSFERMNALARYWVKNTEIELCNRYDLLEEDGAPCKEYLGRAEKPKIASSQPLPHPSQSDVTSDVRGTYWGSAARRFTDLHRWIRTYAIQLDGMECSMKLQVLVDNAATDLRAESIGADAANQVSDTGLSPHPLPRGPRRSTHNKCIIGIARHLQKRLIAPPGAVTKSDNFQIGIWQRRVILIMKILENALGNKFAFGAAELVNKWLMQLQNFVKRIDLDLVNARGTDFKRWIDEQLQSGAGGIHAATKDTIPVMPDTVGEIEEGKHAAQAIVEQELQAWAAKGVWDAVSTPEANTARFDSSIWPEMMPPARKPPTAQEIRGVSKLFPWKTSTGGDAVHPRMLANMSDIALKYLGLLHVNAEVCGEVPEIFRLIILFTRRKKSGSYRVCGNLTTFYRIWTRVRLPIIQDWERDNPSCIFWACAGKGADRAVHTAAVQCDIAYAKGRQAAAGVVDLWKCFEVLKHSIIIEQAKQSNYPMDILKVAISMYQADRYLVLEKATAGPVYAINGITAGCTLAMSILRSTLLPTLEAFYNEVCLPRNIDFQAFVDDLLLLATGSEQYVADVLPFAIKQLLDRLEALYLHAAIDKRKLIATKVMADKILPKLSGLSFSTERCAEYLGVDFGAGRRSSHNARDKRAQVFAARLPKIRGFSKVRAAVGHRMAATAGAPAMAYGDLVYGTSETRLHFQRVIQHRTLLTRESQRSMHLNLHVAGKAVERAYHANSAPILAWAEVVASEKISNEDLRHSATFYQEKLRRSKSVWNSVTGPTSGLHATLARLKWKLIGAHLLKLCDGTFLDLRTCPTTKLNKLIDEATEKYLWRRHNKADPTAQVEFESGANSSAITKLMRKSSALNDAQRVGLGSAATGGQWTNKRHCAAKHTDSDACLLCGAAVGDEWHRIYDCGPLETRRCQFITCNMKAEAAPHRSAHHDRWTRGHLPWSAYPEPPPQPSYVFSQWHNREPSTFSGEVFLDGSNSHPTRPKYSSNACAIVSMKVVNGSPVLDAMLVVQLTNAHDGPEAAEITVVEHALRNGVLPIHAWSDCANVVEGYRRGRKYCCDNGHPQAEHWRRVFAVLDDHGQDAYPQLTIAKIKAHCTEQNYHMYGMSKIQYFGNKWADKGANDAALLQAGEMGLEPIHKEIDMIEGNNKALVRWIAEATALVNTAEMRDAVPPLDKEQMAAKRLATKLNVDANIVVRNPRKRQRPTAPTGAARTFGLQNSNTYVVEEAPAGKYLRASLALDTPGQTDVSEVMTQTIITEIRILDELLDGYNGILHDDDHCTPIDGSSCAAEVTKSSPSSETRSFLAWEMGDDGNSGSACAAAPPVNKIVTKGAQKQRLTVKTSPALASALGYTDDSIDEAQSSPATAHGGYMLRTGPFIWCVRCGAAAQEGNVSKYLRETCKGKPPNASMVQRRSRLVRGCNPNNSKPLYARAARVIIKNELAI